MYYYADGQFDQSVTLVTDPTPIGLRYIKFLTDVVFQPYKQYISLEELDGVYYVRMTDLDKWPANVLFNFCIATRTPLEFPEIIDAWERLLTAGVPETIAFMVAASHKEGPPKGDPWTWKLSYYEYLGSITLPSGHFWFDATSDWGLIYHGTPLAIAGVPSFKEEPSRVRPCNIIWGQMTRETFKVLISKTVKELVDEAETIFTPNPESMAVAETTIAEFVQDPY